MSSSEEVVAVSLFDILGFFMMEILSWPVDVLMLSHVDLKVRPFLILFVYKFQTILILSNWLQFKELWNLNETSCDHFR